MPGIRSYFCVRKQVLFLFQKTGLIFVAGSRSYFCARRQVLFLCQETGLIFVPGSRFYFCVRRQVLFTGSFYLVLGGFDLSIFDSKCLRHYEITEYMALN